MTEPTAGAAQRRAELAANLDELHSEIAAAARSVGRDPSDVTLVVVTKTWPVSDIALLAELGVRDVGENRHQEAEEKATALADLAAEVGLRWHFIGQIQSNKAPRIAHYADVVHSVDSVRVAQRLNAGAHSADRTIDALIQVSLDPDPRSAGRGGVAPDDVADVARRDRHGGRAAACRRDGRRPARCRPGRRLRPADGGVARAAGRLRRCRGRVGGHEQRLRRGHQGGRDTCACRQRGPR